MSLEFEKFILHIKNQVHSFPGEGYLATFSPTVDLDVIKMRHSLIADIQRILIQHTDYDFRHLVEIDKIFSEVQSKAYSFEELRSIISAIKISNIIICDKAYLQDFLAYNQFISPICTFFPFEKRFEEIFDHDGNVLDTASKELKNIRQRLRRLKDNIQSVLNQKLNDSHTAQYLQDKVITKRDERFVIPIKEGFAYMVEGISHGRSGSGASIYIEPKEVVALNNEVNELISAEKEEIYRIFCDFTAEIKAESQSILSNFSIVSKLDVYFACSRVSNELQAIVPEIVSEPIIELHRARHPLLILKFQSLQQVIPFDISLGKDFRVLLISGPNTGGKTILLKAIGLSSMMALTGLPIPADFGSKIGLFSHIYSDIGDNQSIESSLSTFSGHIKNIKEIIEQGDQQSLVLIDEIGSATDPEQGAALGQAILEDIVENKSLAVITTHYTALKIFAENHESCRNASMQFDPEKHEPTYQFVLGFPGNSFAIEIASRLGLGEALITRAKALAGSQNVELTDLIKKIGEEKKRLVKNNYELELKSKLLEIKAKEFSDKTATLEQDKKQLIKNSLSETQDYLTNVQKQLNNELDTLKSLSKEEKKQKIAKMTKDIVDFQQDVRSKKSHLVGRGQETANIQIGDTVWIESFDTTAMIVEIQKDGYRVDMNGIFFECKKGDVSVVAVEKKDEKITLVSRKNTTYDDKAKMEVNLLGKTFEEALPIIQELIDNAIFSGLSKVRIIHGRGTGMLRKKIRDYLKQNKKVIEFYSPPMEAGGDGVTVVSL
jgi:DNA mismatch repair protein MutS2